MNYQINKELRISLNSFNFPDPVIDLMARYNDPKTDFKHRHMDSRSFYNFDKKMYPLAPWMFLNPEDIKEFAIKFVSIVDPGSAKIINTVGLRYHNIHLHTNEYDFIRDRSDFKERGVGRVINISFTFSEKEYITSLIFANNVNLSPSGNNEKFETYLSVITDCLMDPKKYAFERVKDFIQFCRDSKNDR